MSIDIGKIYKLGFGLMRLPENKDGSTDIDRTSKMVDAYMAQVNGKDGVLPYFDTAYVYGDSEESTGKAIVKRYPRDSYCLAAKLPPWELVSLEDRDRIFNEELARCAVDYFDFYLLHSIEDGSNYEKCEALDCFNWGMRKKTERKIKHFGFSFHGKPELLEKVLQKHPEIEFVQIQLNYADWDNPMVQSGTLYGILRKYNKPIIVMEPVKGGTLANLPGNLDAMLKEHRPNASSASWALRFAASLPGVMTALSGMSDETQMADNLKTFKNFEPLTEQEKKVLDAIIENRKSLPLVECTGCRYCCAGCPQKIRIADIFVLLNDIRMYPDDWRVHNNYSGITGEGTKASDCIACEQCEKICPQHLPVIELLKEAAEKLE
jgi:predicted aldo/keto reductase-like oxidoreductase